MTQPIRVPVDVSNPGEFFASCGLLELASRLWPGSVGRFQDVFFEVDAQCPANATLSVLVGAFKDCPLVSERSAVAERGSEEDDGLARPMALGRPFQIALDWWSEKGLKPWAGSMNATVIFEAMRAAIHVHDVDPLNDLRVVYDPERAETKTKSRPKKREPFYFDARRGANARSLDIGFAPDAFSMPSAACPALEALCMIGLQRFRPMPTGPRVFDYCTWKSPLPPSVAAAAACGALSGLGGERYRFENAFRTDQRKHKGFLPATRIGGEQ